MTRVKEAWERSTKEHIFPLNQYPVYRLLVSLDPRFQIPEDTQVTLLLTPKQLEIINYILNHTDHLPKITDVPQNSRAKQALVYNTYNKYHERLHLPSIKELGSLRKVVLQQEIKQLTDAGISPSEIPQHIGKSPSRIRGIRRSMGITRFTRPKEEVNTMNIRIRKLRAVGLSNIDIRAILAKEYPQYADMSTRRRRFVSDALRDPWMRPEMETNPLPRATQIIISGIPTEYVSRLRQVDSTDSAELTRLAENVRMIQQILIRTPNAQVRNSLLELGVPEKYIDKLVTVGLELKFREELKNNITQLLTNKMGLRVVIKDGEIKDFDKLFSSLNNQEYNNLLRELKRNSDKHLFFVFTVVSGKRRRILFVNDVREIRQDDERACLGELQMRLTTYIRKRYEEKGIRLPADISPEDIAGRILEEIQAKAS